MLPRCRTHCPHRRSKRKRSHARRTEKDREHAGSLPQERCMPFPTRHRSPAERIFEPVPGGRSRRNRRKPRRRRIREYLGSAQSSAACRARVPPLCGSRPQQDSWKKCRFQTKKECFHPAAHAPTGIRRAAPAPQGGTGPPNASSQIGEAAFPIVAVRKSYRKTAAVRRSCKAAARLRASAAPCRA